MRSGKNLAVSLGADGERLEDTIIFGRSSRIMIPNALRNELVDAFRPLVSSFCGCELQDDATVGSGGVRVYQRGAYLAHHLDRAHKFVVSATLNIRQANNGTRWPLTMQSFGLRQRSTRLPTSRALPCSMRALACFTVGRSHSRMSFMRRRSWALYRRLIQRGEDRLHSCL